MYPHFLPAAPADKCFVPPVARMLAVSDAGLLGAALVYVIQLGGLFQWAVRQSSEVGVKCSWAVELAASGSRLGLPRLLEPSLGSETNVNLKVLRGPLLSYRRPMLVKYRRCHTKKSVFEPLLILRQ